MFRNEAAVETAFETAVADLLNRYCYECTLRDIELYRAAVTHRTSSKRITDNYERLEFLGDALANMIITDYLFLRYASANEGFLTTLRTRLVNGMMMCDLFSKTGLAPYVRMGHNSGKPSDAVLEDCFESFLAAMYIDQDRDIGKVRRWLIAFLEDNVDFSNIVSINNNFKDALVKEFKSIYNYYPLFNDSCDGSSKYKCQVLTKEGMVLGGATGHSRKTAQLNACKKALEYIQSSKSRTSS